MGWAGFARFRILATAAAGGRGIVGVGGMEIKMSREPS